MNTILNYLKLLRPTHWIKNLLIFAPLIFADTELSIEILLKGIPLFFAFSFLASAVYIINDLSDEESDKVHPTKKLRPIASGEVSHAEAYILMGISFIAALFLSLDLSLKVQLILLAYFIANILYSTKFKHVVILDLFIVAFLYLLRIYVGGKLWDVDLSHWIILCTFFLALFLVSGKRRAELNNLGSKKKNSRMVIRNYNEEFLNHLLTISTTSVIVSYALYTVSIPKPYMVYTSIIVAFGLVRYLYLIYNNNVGEAPEQAVFKDGWVIGLFILWLALVSYIFFRF
ncbi:decaprenyl-phosphate phosphoribosyltransferase [Candidatus Peregrinibacteria bacterium]|nr:decaprenyl-phosphate phosphoribosyltransferase [Candidatus Peregrinibacteria bacterium]